MERLGSSGGGGGGSNGQVAVSALGSGRACPTAVIAFCPSRRDTALLQYEVCCQDQPSSLCPLAVLALGGGGASFDDRSSRGLGEPRTLWDVTVFKAYLKCRAVSRRVRPENTGCRQKHRSAKFEVHSAANNPLYNTSCNFLNFPCVVDEQPR